MSCQAESMADGSGFHTTVLPMSAGAVGRLPAMEVKLNGVTAQHEPVERPVVDAVPHPAGRSPAAP